MTNAPRIFRKSNLPLQHPPTAVYTSRCIFQINPPSSKSGTQQPEGTSQNVQETGLKCCAPYLFGTNTENCRSRLVYIFGQKMPLSKFRQFFQFRPKLNWLITVFDSACQMGISGAKGEKCLMHGGERWRK